MNSLSTNILCEIFKYLTFKELCILSSTCKKLEKVCEADILWLESPDQFSGTERKRIFSTRMRITHNIFQKVKQIYILSGHSRSIKTIKVKGDKVLTSSEDGTVRLWKTRKNKGLVIVSHNNFAVSAKFWDQGVVSVSADRTLKVWKKDKSVKSEFAHRAAITALKKINENIFATGSYDGCVKIWDLRNLNNLVNSKDFDGDINLLETYQNLYASSSSNSDYIALRDLNAPNSLQKFQINNPMRIGRAIPPGVTIRSLLLSDQYLYSGETDSIKIWDLRAQNPVITAPIQALPFNFDNQSGIFKIILKNENELFLGSNGLTGLVHYDLRNLKSKLYQVHDCPIQTISQGQNTLKNLIVTSGTTKSFTYELSVHKTENPELRIKHIPGHKGVINALDIGEDCIASGGKDGSVRVLKFNNNKTALKSLSKTLTIIAN